VGTCLRGGLLSRRRRESVSICLSVRPEQVGSGSGVAGRAAPSHCAPRGRLTRACGVRGAWRRRVVPPCKAGRTQSRRGVSQRGCVGRCAGRSRACSEPGCGPGCVWWGGRVVVRLCASACICCHSGFSPGLCGSPDVACGDVTWHRMDVVVSVHCRLPRACVCVCV